MNDNAIRGTSDFAARRRVMVDRQIRTFDVTNQEVLGAFLDIPRERFLPPALAPLAYSDACLDVGPGGSGEPRRLLLPMALARMIQALGVRSQDRCLDIAGGGGYGAALLSRLGASALAVDDAEAFAARAQAVFDALGFAHASARTGSLRDAAGAVGPFDAILVNGAVEVAPERLFGLLTDGGRLVAILKDKKDPTGSAARATLWSKSNGQIGRASLFNSTAPVLPDFAAPATFSF